MNKKFLTELKKSNVSTNIIPVDIMFVDSRNKNEGPQTRNSQKRESIFYKKYNFTNKNPQGSYRIISKMFTRNNDI
jgi:hypothetical protein